MLTNTQIQTVPAKAQIFRDNVHKWIKEEGEAKELHSRWVSVRSARDETEAAIVAALLAQGMNKAILQVKQGAIHMASHTNSANLSFGMLEELLPQYFRSKGLPDQSAELIAFVRAHRSTKTEYTLEMKPKKD